MDDILVRILTVYERLTGMKSAYAAFLYIVDVQQCEGYGEEAFTAKVFIIFLNKIKKFRMMKVQK